MTAGDSDGCVVSAVENRDGAENSHKEGSGAGGTRCNRGSLRSQFQGACWEALPRLRIENTF